MDINEEIDQVILQSILRFGADAIPMDYAFLNRYGLKYIYFQSINTRMEGMSIREINRRLFTHIRSLIRDTDFPLLRELYSHGGKKCIYGLLYWNNLYYKTVKLKIKSHDNSHRLHTTNSKTLYNH